VVLDAVVKWRAATEDVAVHGWDSQIVAYDRRSGDTHCLDHTASAVLTCLLDAGALTEDDLGERVAAGDQAAGDALTAVLAELQTLGLVRRIEEC
jgi:PqqD family protein of HPr-rel-A system